MPEILNNKYELADSTFIAKDISFAQVEIGDIKTPDVFLPQFKIMRWDNEVNFSVRLVTDAQAVAVGTPDDMAAVQAVIAQNLLGNIKSGGTLIDPAPGDIEPAPAEITPAVALVDDKVQWVTPAQEVHFYSYDDDQGGGYEVEVVLNEPPATNVIAFTIETKGLDFFYQPELTAEEVEHGADRPDKVVGSYAVYHKTMAGDYTALGGKYYAAGKAFHIYRPRIEDADGNWTWGDLSIDEVAQLLTVTIPQDFLDKATYPVRHAAGLEFGYKSVGGSSDSWVSTTYFCCKAIAGGGDPGTPASSGALTAIYAHIRCLSVSGLLQPALYADNGGSPSAPSTRLAYITSGGGTITSTFAWVSTAISYASLVAGTQYWLGVYNADASEQIWLHYDAGTKSLNSGSSWGNPYTTGYSYDRIASVYAVYTPAGSEYDFSGVAGISSSGSTSDLLLLKALSGAAAMDSVASGPALLLLKALTGVASGDTVGSSPALLLLKALSGSGALDTSASSAAMLLLKALSGVAAGDTAGSTPSLLLLKALSGTISMDTAGSVPDLNVLRSLSGVSALDIGLSSPIMAILRALSGTVALGSTGSTPVLNILRVLSGTAALDSLGSSLALLLLKALAGTGAMDSVTASVVLSLLGLYELTGAANITSTSSGPALLLLKELSGIAAGDTAGSSAALLLLKALSGAATLESLTPIIILILNLAAPEIFGELQVLIDARQLTVSPSCRQLSVSLED